MAESANHAAADAVRNAATDYLRSHRWADFLALEPALRDDREYWISFWAACAIASWHEGRADARELLEECIGDAPAAGLPGPLTPAAGRVCRPGPDAAYARSTAVV